MPTRWCRTSGHEVIPLAEARAVVLSACHALEPRRVPARDSEGLVLAEAVLATEAVPPFANSAMDGYALRAADTTDAPALLQVVGTVMAGDALHLAVSAGQAVRIMTGAPVPVGVDAVCMVERTRSEADGSLVIIEDTVAAGTNVRHAGEDITAGAEVFAPGTCLRPAHIGVLASLGVETIVAYPLPAVGVLSTGDELVIGSGALPTGKIRDANRPALLAQVRADGLEALDLGVTGDDEGELARRLEEGAGTCDALVASGGVSVGDRDVMKTVLEKLCGSVTRSMEIAIKPAKPFAFGVLEASGVPVFGLPGNPVSALVSYELLVRPALRLMSGQPVLERLRLTAVAEADFARHRDGKLHLVRVVVRRDPRGSLLARPCRGQGSHMLHAMAESNGLALLPDGEGLHTGDAVDVLVLDPEDLAGPSEDAR